MGENRSFQSSRITAEGSCSEEKTPVSDRAVAGVIDRTINRLSPWALAPANDGHFVRIMVRRMLLEWIDASLRQRNACTASRER